MMDGILTVSVLHFVSCSHKSVHQNFVLQDAESCEAVKCALPLPGSGRGDTSVTQQYWLLSVY